MRNKDFDIWMIRIKGDEKSELYANYCAKSWTDAGFHVNFFDAITPKDLHRFKSLKWQRQINDAEKGCFISQWLLWKKCWEEDRPILVLEHDAYLERPEVISYNPHVDITYFGQHCMEACLYRPSFAKFIWKVVTEDKNKGPFSMIEHFLGQGSRYSLLSRHGRPQLRYLGPEAPVKHLVIDELGSTIVHNSGKQTSDRIHTDQSDLFKVVSLRQAQKSVKPHHQSLNGWHMIREERTNGFIQFTRVYEANTPWWNHPPKFEPDQKFPNVFKDIMYPLVKSQSERRTAIDVGASYGFMTDAFAQLYDHVHAFEIVEPIRDCLKLNVKEHNNVTIHEGASDETRLNVPVLVPERYSGHGTMRKHTHIPPKEAQCTKYYGNTKTIDSLNITDLDFLKIDVEGHELEVLTGAEETLKNNSPIIIVESLTNQSSYDQTDLVSYDHKTSEEVVYKETLPKIRVFLKKLGYVEKINFDDDYIFVKEV